MKASAEIPRDPSERIMPADSESHHLPSPEHVGHAILHETAAPNSEAPSEAATESLGLLSLNEVKIDLEAAKSWIGENTKADLEAKAERWGEFTPMVAEAVVHQQEERPPQAFKGPTAERIKQESSLARTVSRFLGFFSQKWAARFDNYLEGKARDKVMRIARRITVPVNAIGSVAAPKKQFVNELEALYNRLATTDHEDKRDQPQEKLPRLIRRMYEAHNLAPHRWQGFRGHWYKPQQYPLLGKLLPIFKLPTYEMSEGRVGRIRAASPEIIKGVEQFLKKQGADVGSAQFTPYRSVTRKLVQRLAPQMLENLPDRVEATLTRVYDTLPEDGHEFAESVYALCKKVAQLGRQGEDGKKLAQDLLHSLWR
jgi:hypothetical protein